MIESKQNVKKRSRATMFLTVVPLFFFFQWTSPSFSNKNTLLYKTWFLPLPQFFPESNKNIYSWLVYSLKDSSLSAIHIVDKLMVFCPRSWNSVLIRAMSVSFSLSPVRKSAFGHMEQSSQIVTKTIFRMQDWGGSMSVRLV